MVSGGEVASAPPGESLSHEFYDNFSRPAVWHGRGHRWAGSHSKRRWAQEFRQPHLYWQHRGALSPHKKLPRRIRKHNFISDDQCRALYRLAFFVLNLAANHIPQTLKV